MGDEGNETSDKTVEREIRIQQLIEKFKEGGQAAVIQASSESMSDEELEEAAEAIARYLIGHSPDREYLRGLGFRLHIEELEKQGGKN